MQDYTRPPIEPVEFRDADGVVIPYGRRWESRGWTPPEESYSVDEHPERFVPLHPIAEALIEHLVANYEVTLEEGDHLTEGLLHPPAAEDTVRAVRLTPAADAAAPMVIVLTSYPSVWLHAGVLYDTAFPSCGCSACDETWEGAAGELEWHTLAIANGGFAEAVSEPRRRPLSFGPRGERVLGLGQTVSYRLSGPDGAERRSGQSDAEALPALLLEHARQRLEAVAAVTPDGAWRAWPRR